MGRYTGEQVRIVAERSLVASVEKLEMLRSYGFNCTHEFHAGFWLVHYQLPRLRLVGGYEMRS